MSTPTPTGKLSVGPVRIESERAGRQRCGCIHAASSLLYCPLHLEAPAMRDELRNFVAYYDNRRVHLLGDGHALQHYQKATALLAQIENG